MSEMQEALTDVERRAVEIHTRDMWDRLPLSGKAHYRLQAAAELVQEGADHE